MPPGGSCAASLILGAAIQANAAAIPATTLWYAQPAEKWTDALPIGNGRLGAMIFGGIPDERIQFNEDTLWKGQPHNYVRAGAEKHLVEIRQLLFDGKIKEAETLTRETFLSDPVRQKAYQPFGDLRLHFTGQDNATNYQRELGLDSAIARVTCRADGVTYQRGKNGSVLMNSYFLCFPYCCRRGGGQNYTIIRTDPYTTRTDPYTTCTHYVSILRQSLRFSHENQRPVGAFLISRARARFLRASA